ncbi:hypothetical protein Thiowin_03777 [Thiorhodovibrio winogradskyi]|uniref:GT-D fold-like domain-containing protein n=1 Tax=Thiorhodovibrio winogradskyi TaxID=77007 RepID=A0ABZ0SDN4_9GAMM|nr:hypothetical protein [Thiorhodovibrio winogradskyi]
MKPEIKDKLDEVKALRDARNFNSALSLCQAVKSSDTLEKQDIILFNHQLATLLKYLNRHDEACDICISTLRMSDTIPDYILAGFANIARIAADFETGAECIRRLQALSVSDSINASIIKEHQALLYFGDWLQNPKQEFVVSNVTQVFDKIHEYHEAQRPLSFLRLGDGEGNILARGEEGYEKIIDEWTRRILTMQFANLGETEISKHAEDIFDLVKKATLNADAIGIPNIKALQNPTAPVDRQLGGNIAVHLFLKRHAAELQHPLFCDSCICYDAEFAPMLKQLLVNLDFIGVIGPHSEFCNRVRGINNKVKFAFHQTPGENCYFKPSVDHFPTRFNEICEEISPPYPAAVYLVGAGILGKYYCELIRVRGGIAIDIGSLMDGISGFSQTRTSLVRLKPILDQNFGNSGSTTCHTNS